MEYPIDILMLPLEPGFLPSKCSDQRQGWDPKATSIPPKMSALSLAIAALAGQQHRGHKGLEQESCVGWNTEIVPSSQFFNLLTSTV